VTLFLIAPAIGLIMTVLMSMILQIPFPFHPIQLLWMNLVTNGLQDVALCFEKGEAGIEDRPPRNPCDGVLSNLVYRLIFTGVIMTIAVLGIFSWQINHGATLGQARTIAISTLICMQFFYAFMSRSEKRMIFSYNFFSNRFLLITVGVAFIAHLLAIYHPAMQFILRTEPINVKTLLLVLLVSSSILVVEIEKYFKQRNMDNF
jgi:Ca2+-transporting ATPase